MRSAALFFALFGRVVSAEPAIAEYAFRWNPKDGGPATVERIRGILGGKTKSVKTWEVRYYRVPDGEGGTGGTRTILRERRNPAGDAEYRLKFRRSTPFESPYTCPSGMEFSYEKDISFDAPRSTRSAYSLSCTGASPGVVDSLKAKPSRCHSALERHDGKKYRVESWTFPDGSRLLEVSHRSENTPAELERFGALVDGLVRAGAKPSTSSKTDLGSNCEE